MAKRYYPTPCPWIEEAECPECSAVDGEPHAGLCAEGVKRGQATWRARRCGADLQASRTTYADLVAEGDGVNEPEPKDGKPLTRTDLGTNWQVYCEADHQWGEGDDLQAIVKMVGKISVECPNCGARMSPDLLEWEQYQGTQNCPRCGVGVMEPPASVSCFGPRT